MALLPPAPGKFKALIVVGVAFLGLLIAGAIFGDRGVIDLQRLYAEQERLEDTAFVLQQDNARLRARIERSADPQEVERRAREELRWAKPGEVVYRFAKERAGSAAQPQAAR